MSPATSWLASLVRDQVPQQKIRFGPWLGSMRSVTQDLVPPDYIFGGSDFLYLPRSGRFKRRMGQVQKFDTFGASIGLLPAHWGAKCRQLEEFTSPSIADGVPTLIALATKETVASGLDDGRFSNVFVRDQVNNQNYTVGSEFSTTTTYPVPGSAQAYKFVPLWYDSGDGGITRGITEFQRRLFFRGSRKMLKVGQWHYFPTLLGTPSRWQGRGTESTVTPTTFTPFTTPEQSNPSGSITSDTNYHTDLNTNDGDAGRTYVHNSGAGTSSWFSTLTTLPTVATGSLTVTWVAKTLFSPTVGNTFRYGVTLADGFTRYGITHQQNEGTGSYATYTETFDISGVGVNIGGTNIFFCETVSNGFDSYYIWTSVVVTANVASGATEATRLIPSGPIPPTHCGSIAKGNPSSSSVLTTARPTSDISTGSWTPTTGTTLYPMLGDEANPNTSNIRSAIGVNTVCEVKLDPFGFTPQITDVVTINFRVAHFHGGLGNTQSLKVELVQTATVRATAPLVTDRDLAFYYYSYQLTDAEITAITSGGGWTDLRLRFTTQTSSAIEYMAVSYAELRFAPVASALGGWHGSDRFPFALAYRFEDDSVFGYTVPRFPNSNLPNGFGIFTVDSVNPTVGYDKVTWTLPVPPAGVKKVLLLRGTKIDSTTQDNLAMDPNSMRIVDEVDAGVTTYDDFNADDDALDFDADQLLIRQDHIMPPRARWIGAGAYRVAHSYGGLNPTCIELAPVAVTTANDRNLADTAAAAYNNPSNYYQVKSDRLRLLRDDGAATSYRDFLWSAYATLQDLVDAINATALTDTWTALTGAVTLAAQWRAQLVYGISPQAATSNICPTLRTLAGCTVSGQTITAASGLSAMPVGAFITSSGGGTDGAYVSVINTDLSLTFVGTLTAGGPFTLTFTASTGDQITGQTHGIYEGYVRSICNALPSFLFFTKTYLNQFPIEKDAIWMTVGNPESVKSAANCFSGAGPNKHKPDRDVGISMGIAGIENGFVTPFNKNRGVIVNTRDAGTGLDKDYHLFVSDDSGCCGPVVQGNNVAFVCAPEGWLVKDLESERFISGAIYKHPVSDATTGVGDFSYEMPLGIAAAAADTDTSFMYAEVMRSALWVNYRSSGALPNRQVVYDFSSADAPSGIASVLRRDGTPFGWSNPLVRAFSCMAEGRRADGAHLYGWNDANAGSIGDGRIDEFETTDTDNGVAISGSLTTGWFRFGVGKLSAQEIWLEHVTPAGAVVALKFHRSYQDDAYTMTPTAGSGLVVTREPKYLPLPARAPTAACFLEWDQTSGGASEVRVLELRAKDLPSYT